MVGNGTGSDEVLAEAVGLLDRSQIDCLLIGGLAAARLGRPRTTEDIDLLIRARDAKSALVALGEAGFDTEETDEKWIYKAWRDGRLVDLIFWLKGGISLDDEMLAHARPAEVDGQRLLIAPPEDLVVVKAVVHDEATPRHWHDALGLIASGSLDWDYLLARARYGARRVLSLLLYAQSNDLLVPDHVVRALWGGIYGNGRA
jgi:hypothetical protein